MEAFRELKDAKNEYDVVVSMYHSCKEEAQEICEATKSRLEAGMKQDRARIEELDEVCMNSTRSETFKAFARAEKEKLEARTYNPTEEEKEAFEKAYNGAIAAVEDAKKVKEKMRELATKAAKELEEFRANTVGKGGFDTILAERHIEGEKSSFYRLSQNEGK